MVEQPTFKVRTIPGVPIAKEGQAPDFRTVEVEGSRLIVSLEVFIFCVKLCDHQPGESIFQAYPTSSGVVIHDQSLDYVCTLPLPSNPVRISRKETSSLEDNLGCGLSSDQEGSASMHVTAACTLFNADFAVV
jgi:hypothetical protein